MTDRCPNCGYDPDRHAFDLRNHHQVEIDRRRILLDPFGGSGTTSLVTRQLGRHSIYVDLSEEYARLALKRLQGQALALPW